jgi:glycerate-2-kinase
MKMKIRNERELVRNATSENDSTARVAALEIIKSGVAAVNPHEAVRRHVKRVGNRLVVHGKEYNLDKFENVAIVGGGKASGAMAETLEEILGEYLTTGFVNVLKKNKAVVKTKKVKLNYAGHPMPDEKGLKGSKLMVEFCRSMGKKGLIFFLISGGGSALLPYPADGISLEDKQNVTDALLMSGATINEINAVRKHLSLIKGGQFLRYVNSSEVISLIISDVVGDPLDVIASGPTAPDPTTYLDAVSILKRHKLWTAIPENVRSHLQKGVKGDIPETPKAGDQIFRKVNNMIVGSNRVATTASYEKAKQLGYNALFLSSYLEGESRHVGTALASLLQEIDASDNPVPKPAAIIAGGETTVTVAGTGKGGRNQELVLSASMKISGLSGVAIISIGTDGIDGPTDAAGAIADGKTLLRASDMNLDALRFLDQNNAYQFFKNLKDLIITGPTGTNVNDLTVLVAT